MKFWKNIKEYISVNKVNPIGIDMNFVFTEEYTEDDFYESFNDGKTDVETIASVLELGSQMTYQERAEYVLNETTISGISLIVGTHAQFRADHDATLRQYIVNVFSLSEANFRNALSATRRIVQERGINID